MVRPHLVFRRLIEGTRQSDRIVAVASDLATEQLDVDEAERDATAQGRVRRRAGVADRQQSGCTRFAVHHEPAVTVDDSGHRPHLTDRLAIEPVGLQRTSTHDALVHIGIPESSQLFVL